MQTAAVLYITFVVVLSLVGFALTAHDKRRAGTGGRRVSERTFYLIAFLGGWPGAWLAQRQFRHKTRKISFRAAFWTFAVFHVALVAAVTYRLARSGESEAAESVRPIERE